MDVGMTKKAKAYLHLIGQTEDAAVKLTRGYAKQTDELISLGYAVFIPESVGGGWIALTQDGINKYDEMWPLEQKEEAS